MSWKQVQPFIVTRAGTKPYWCLQNVRLGYGLAAHYEYALLDWQNNIAKHADQNFPAGVDVPVYFNWTGTVGGVNKNWGHIAVRLSDGRVWTDGKYFANVNELSRNYLGGQSYLGWGESVENIRVVQEVQDMAGIPDHDNYYGRYNKLMIQVRGREMSRDEFRKNIVGVSDLTAVERISDNPESDRATDYQQWALANRANIEKQISDLTNRVNQLSGEVKGLAQTINEKQAEISSLQDKAADLEKENKELKAQLATCGGDDTELLNSFGEILRKIIARLGVKK